MVQTVITAGVMMPVRGRATWKISRMRLVVLRGFMHAVSGAIAFFSLSLMPVAEYSAIIMLTPMLLTLVSALALKERVSATTWTLLAGALVGALLVVQPGGAGFGWAVLLPLILICLNVGYQLLTRHLTIHMEPASMHLYSGLFSMVFVSLALPFGWQAPETWSAWGLVLLLSLFSAVGHYLMIVAYSLATPATLSPFIYLQLVFATLAGWLVFDHMPDGLAWIGMGLIASCGIASARPWARPVVVR
jgi:drug/metabolite transporter (DMT)-like permease